MPRLKDCLTKSNIPKDEQVLIEADVRELMEGGLSETDAAVRVIEGYQKEIVKSKESVLEQVGLDVQKEILNFSTDEQIETTGTEDSQQSGNEPGITDGETGTAEQAPAENNEQNEDDIDALSKELENELKNSTELGTGGFASETNQYDAAILRTNEQSTTAFGNLSGLPASAIEGSLEATGRVLWVEYPKQQGDGIAEQQPVPISYKRAADARQLGGGVLLVGDQDYSGATLQNIRQEFGAGSQQFKYELSHVLATRLLQPGNFTGKLLRSNKALSAVDIILDNNPKADSYFLIYNSAGFIKINMAAAAKRYELLGEKAFWPYAETALQEEVIHAVSDVITTGAEWETVYNELTPDEVASIKELYDKDDLTNKQVAGEYVRMMVQEKVFGVTTELFTLRSTQGLLNTFKKLLSYLKGVFAGNPNRVSKEVIERVEQAVREMNAEVEEGRGGGNLGEMGTGGFQSNFNNNATVENFIRRNIDKYSEAAIIQAVMKATGQDEKYARGMLDIAKKPLNEQQQEQLNEEVVDENVGELQDGERARNTTRKIPELDIATVQNISEEAVKYFQKSNVVSLDEANRFIDNKPITDVVNYLLNIKKDGLTDDKRSTLFVAAINKLTTQITEARAAGDNTLAESLALNQSQLLNEYMPQTTEWGRAIQIIRLLYNDPKNKGLFADQTAKEVIKKINEQAETSLNKQEEEELTELIKEYAEAPEGLKQAELMAKINQFAAEKIDLNFTDILTSIWYAKILSGPGTHVTNISSNVFNAPFELANFAIRTAVKHKTLKHFAPMMGGFLRGLYRGFSEFGGILATGITTQESQKFFQSPLMETLDWNQVDNRTLRALLKNPVLFSFNPKVLRYVGRLLAGSDAMLQSASQESVAAALGEVYAKDGAKKGDLRKASDYLYNNKEDIEAAKMQAEKEGFKKDTFKSQMQFNRRVSEIINSKRAFEILDKSRKEAAKTTFNYEPKGIIARSIYNVITFGQKEIKILPFYVPFVRIVTNLVDNMMNYSPVGFVSAGIGKTKDSKGVRKMTKDERAEIFIKGLIGTSTLLALAAVAGDDEDDWFEVTANGTGDMLKNYELQKTGWRPYTITLKDGTSVSYKNTPLFPVFAAIGGARDWDKYKRKENEDPSTSEEMRAAAGMFAFSIFDNSWLTGVNDLINTANITDDRGQVKQGLGGIVDKATRKGVDVASAFLLSNFSKSMIRYADAFNEKPLTKPDNDFERIVRDIPWVRDEFIDKQITDVWGDPVINESWMGLSPFRVKPEGFVKDEVIDLLIKNNIWIGRPRANKELYDTESDNTRLMTKDEYYRYYNRAGQLLKQKLYDLKESLQEVDGDREAMLKIVSDAKKEANEEAFTELFNN